MKNHGKNPAVPLLPLAGLLLALTVAAGNPTSGGDPKPAEPSGYVDRMATEHQGDEPVASPAAKAEEAGADVETSQVTYATVGGKRVRGYFARPPGAKDAPGILVIHEWWGLNDNIRSMARQLAAQGYAALAVDLYAGEVASDPQGARGLMSQAMENPAPVEDNLRQGHEWLRKEAGARQVGSIGWCFGGAWSLRAALLMPELDATVIYYGRVVTDREELAKVKTPILGLFGGEDQGIPVDSVRQFESTLKDLGKSASIHVYEGANHAFANPSGTRYDAEAAEDAWSKTLAFLAEHLKS